MIKHIPEQEFREVTETAEAAKELLEDERFKFLRDFFTNNETYVTDSILNNTIRDVKETVPVTERITKTFFTPKKVQVDELSGQYKLIQKYYEHLNYFINTKADMDKAIAEGKVKVDGKPIV